MKVEQTNIPGVLILEPKVFGDERGFFFESFNQRTWREATGLDTRFVQENHSRSRKGVLRGLHYQIKQTQAKLVRVILGEVFDVAVDIRVGSPTFGRHVAVELTGENHRQLFIPRGFAHGFVVLSPEALFQYKCDAFYAPDQEGAIAWNDPALGIDWGLPEADIILSEKDRHHPLLAQSTCLFNYDTDYYAQ